MINRLLPTEFVSTRKKYVLFKNDCGVTDMTRKGGIYEHYIFDYIRKNIQILGKNIIDVGANFGFHSLEFSDLVGSHGKVFSFEPQRLVYYQLCANIILNGYNNIFAYNTAIGNENGETTIEEPNYYSDSIINIGDSHVSTNNPNISRHSIEIKKLDYFKFENVGVIKIDVQGFEPFVLDGAEETIKKNLPHIFIEIEPSQLEIYRFTTKDVIDKLNSMGYITEKVLDYPHLVDYVSYPKI